MQKPSNMSRRGFLESTLTGLVGAGLPLWYAQETLALNLEKDAAAPRKIGPNDTIVMGAIGVGGQGTGIMKWAKSMKGVKVVALADVDATHREKVNQKELKGEAKLYNDFREMLEKEDLDAVTIGTPDHWHALTAIAAMKAGCDVYCEKPLTLTIDEGHHMIKAARKYDRVFQTGSQQRSDARFRLACELVRNGRIGNIKVVEARIGDNPQGGPFPTAKVPEGLDWNFWQGPTPDVPYVKERCHYEFRWWKEYSGGKFTDWGAHHNDIAQWGLGMDDSGPIAVTAVGEEVAKKPNSYNHPRNFTATFQYANGAVLNCSSMGENGVRFVGDKGWIFVSRSRIAASDKKILDEPLGKDAVRLYHSDNHMGNFMDGIRTRKAPICDVAIAHRSVTVCHLANIALQIGRPLNWDPKAQNFGSDADANKYLSREMRSPWKFEV